MFRFLQTPFPLQLNTRTNGLVALSLGVFAWAFLAFYQPFGIATLPDGPAKWGFLAGFGLGLVAVYTAVTIGGARLWPRFFDENSWTVGREIAKSAVLIGLLGAACWLNALLFGHAAASVAEFGYFQKITWAGSVIPMAGLTLWKQLTSTRRRLAQTERSDSELRQRVQHLKTLPPTDALLHLHGASATEILRLPRSAVWLLRADDNYVEVIYRDQNGFKKHLLRATLKRLETQLAPFPEFYRCHRSHLVNLNKVRRVSGQAPNYRLELEDFAEAVPVGRSLAKPVLDRLYS